MKLKLCVTGKRCFADERSAWKRLCAIRNSARHQEPHLTPRRIYECEHCGFWHLTSKANKYCAAGK